MKAHNIRKYSHSLKDSYQKNKVQSSSLVWTSEDVPIAWNWRKPNYINLAITDIDAFPLPIIQEVLILVIGKSVRTVESFLKRPQGIQAIPIPYELTCTTPRKNSTGIIYTQHLISGVLYVTIVLHIYDTVFLFWTPQEKTWGVFRPTWSSRQRVSNVKIGWFCQTAWSLHGYCC